MVVLEPVPVMPPFHAAGTAWQSGEVTLVYRTNNCWNQRRFKTEGEVNSKLWGKFKKDEVWGAYLTPPSFLSSLSFQKIDMVIF